MKCTIRECGILTKWILDYYYDMDTILTEKIIEAKIQCNYPDGHIENKVGLLINCTYYDPTTNEELEYLQFIVPDEKVKEATKIDTTMYEFVNIIKDIAQTQPCFVGLENAILYYLENENQSERMDENIMNEIYNNAINYEKEEINKKLYLN